jgi:hypothetical protein
MLQPTQMEAFGLGTERQDVHLHLARMHVAVAFLATRIATGDNTRNTNGDVLEVFKVPIEFLNATSLELLRAGGTLKASVVRIAPFRIREEASGEVVAATPFEVSRRFLTLSAPTLCGSALARGLVSLSFEGDKKSIVSKTSYFHAGENDTQDNRKLSSAKGSAKKSSQQVDKTLKSAHSGDVCDSVDVLKKGCSLGRTECFIKYTRKKRIEKKVCLGVGQCGKRSAGTMVIESKNKFDSRLFEGQCGTIKLRKWPDDCECSLTSASKKELVKWQTEQLHNVLCSTECCTAQGMGGKSGNNMDSR